MLNQKQKAFEFDKFSSSRYQFVIVKVTVGADFLNL